MISKNRKIMIVFLTFGFTFIVQNNIEVPQCVMCNAISLKCIHYASLHYAQLVKKYVNLKLQLRIKISKKIYIH